MTAIFKNPEQAARFTEIGTTERDLTDMLGGDYDVIPALAGAMVLCRAVDVDLPYNVHFLGRHYSGPILIVGRGEGNCPVNLPRNLQKILLMALGGGKK